MHQEITLIHFCLIPYYQKIKPIKFPYQCEFPNSFTMEVLANVLSCVDKEENDPKQEMEGKAKVDLAIAKHKNTLRIKTTRKRKK